VPVGSPTETESTLTVLIAFGANLLIAVAKTFAAILTGSASLVAESAHSWADTGNEIFLMIANKRSRRPAGPGHPLGYGREAYVWSLFAALGLFVAGAAVSITHGIHELLDPEPAGDFIVGYVVLALSLARIFAQRIGPLSGRAAGPGLVGVSGIRSGGCGCPTRGWWCRGGRLGAGSVSRCVGRGGR
jgi:hypothetical protein